MKLDEAEREAAALDPAWTVMVHPDLEDSFTLTTREALTEVWEEKGWEEARLLDPDSGQTLSSLEREAQANAEAEARAQEKPSKAKAAGAPAEQADPTSTTEAPKE